MVVRSSVGLCVAALMGVSCAVESADPNQLAGEAAQGTALQQCRPNYRAKSSSTTGNTTTTSSQLFKTSASGPTDGQLARHGCIVFGPEYYPSKVKDVTVGRGVGPGIVVDTSKLAATGTMIDGQVYCAGTNPWGQLGQGRLEKTGLRTDFDPALPVLGPDGKTPLSSVLEIASSDNVIAAITEDGRAYAWGKIGDHGVLKGYTFSAIARELPAAWFGVARERSTLHVVAVEGSTSTEARSRLRFTYAKKSKQAPTSAAADCVRLESNGP
jgi:hypothetical protein